MTHGSLESSATVTFSQAFFAENIDSVNGSLVTNKKKLFIARIWLKKNCCGNWPVCATAK
jgi:hypothetical protein